MDGGQRHAGSLTLSGKKPSCTQPPHGFYWEPWYLLPRAQDKMRWLHMGSVPKRLLKSIQSRNYDPRVLRRCACNNERALVIMLKGADPVYQLDLRADPPCIKRHRSGQICLLNEAISACTAIKPQTFRVPGFL